MRRDIIRVAIVSRSCCSRASSACCSRSSRATPTARATSRGRASSTASRTPQVDGTLGSDGALTVSERITFEFHGNFSGAFRDIPLADNQTFEEIGVREGATDYDSGASTELGGFGLPDTFGAVADARRERPARGAHRLALLGHGRDAHVPDPLPRPRADAGARRRGRRVLAGVGRRLEGLARQARRDADHPGRRARGRRAHLGPSRQRRRHRPARGPQDRAGRDRACRATSSSSCARCCRAPRSAAETPGAQVDDDEAFDRIVARGAGRLRAERRRRPQAPAGARQPAADGAGGHPRRPGGARSCCSASPGSATAASRRAATPRSRTTRSRPTTPRRRWRWR